MKHLGWMLLLLFLCLSCQKRTRNNIAFYLNITSEPSTLNPLKSSDNAASSVQNFIIESLLQKDDETYEWIPSLAVKWKISEDKTKFTFWLREGVLWSDGVPFTAEDVEFSFKTTFDVKKWKNAEKQFLFESIKSVKAIDKLTVEIEVKDKVYSNFSLVAGTLPIVPKHFYSQDKKRSFFNKNIIGTGPYKLEKWHRGNRVVLLKNDLWWGRKLEPYNKKYHFPKMVLRWIDNPTVAIEMLKKGKIDFQGMRAEDYEKKTKGPEWGKTVHKVKTKNSTPKSYCFIGLNFKNKKLKDKRVRKALFHLLNRRLMIEKFEYNYSVPAVGPIYPQSPIANKDLKPVEYNPKRALALLREAGWRDSNNDGILDKNGQKLSLTILEPSSIYMKYLTVFKEDAKKVGVDLEVKQIEWNSFIKLVTQEKSFDMCRLCWSATVDWSPKQIWHSDSIDAGNNFISYSNPKVDVLIEKARFEFDREKRIKLLREVERRIVDDVPYLFISYKEPLMYGYTDRIKRPKDTFNYTIGSDYWDFKTPKLKAK